MFDTALLKQTVDTLNQFRDRLNSANPQEAAVINEVREYIRELMGLGDLIKQYQKGEFGYQPTPCYCCSCSYDNWGVQSWDPACHNHGAHGRRGCLKHGVPSQECDCGCEVKR